MTSKEVFEFYSNDDLVDEVERGLKVGYWDKALIRELRSRLKKADKAEKLLGQYKKVADAIVRISSKYPLYVIRESEGKMVEQSFNRIKELENE
jgi:hypothetical protein